MKTTTSTNKKATTNTSAKKEREDKTMNTITKEIERINKLPAMKNTATKKATKKDRERAFECLRTGKTTRLTGLNTDNPIAEEYKVLFEKIMKRGFNVKHCGKYCSTRYILSLTEKGKTKNVILINTGKKAPRIQMLKENLPEKFTDYHMISGYQLDTVPHNLTYINILDFIDSCQF